jgi:hypothetical protein
MTNTDNFVGLVRGHLQAIAGAVDAAPDLDDRIAVKVRARRRKRTQTIVAAVSTAAVAGVTFAVFLVTAGGGHSDGQRVAILGAPPVTSAESQMSQPAPATRDVSRGRFVRSTSLDNGLMVVQPAPTYESPSIGASKASLLYHSDSTIVGTAPTEQVFGFGLVTIDQSLISGVHQAPAWVEFFWSDSQMCPKMPQASAESSGSVTGTISYRAVIILGSGTRVLDYLSGGSVCGTHSTGPSVTGGQEVLSVPWRFVSAQGSMITYQYQEPGCLPRSAKTSAPSTSFVGNAKTGGGTLSVQIAVPYDLLSCKWTWQTATSQIWAMSGTSPHAIPTESSLIHSSTGAVG